MIITETTPLPMTICKMMGKILEPITPRQQFLFANQLRSLPADTSFKDTPFVLQHQVDPTDLPPFHPLPPIVEHIPAAPITKLFVHPPS
jgi:hypothetical protein